MTTVTWILQKYLRSSVHKLDERRNSKQLTETDKTFYKYYKRYRSGRKDTAHKKYRSSRLGFYGELTPVCGGACRGWTPGLPPDCSFPQQAGKQRLSKKNAFYSEGVQTCQNGSHYTNLLLRCWLQTNPWEKPATQGARAAIVV